MLKDKQLDPHSLHTHESNPVSLHVLKFMKPVMLKEKHLILNRQVAMIAVMRSVMALRHNSRQYPAADMDTERLTTDRKILHIN